MIKHKLISLPQSSNGIMAFLRIHNSKKPPLQKAFEFMQHQGIPQSEISSDRLFKDIVPVPEEVFSSIVVLDLLGSTSEIDAGFKKINLAYIKTYLEMGKISFFKEEDMKRALPPDVDCTAFGAYVLTRHGEMSPLQIQETAQLILSNVNEQGQIQVYFPDRKHREGRLDPVVSMNALCFLYQIGRGDEARKTEDYVYDFLSTGKHLEGTRYYPSPDAFLYFCARMINSSEQLKDRFTPLLREKIKERIGQTPYPIDCAFRLIVCQRLGIENLMDKQSLLANQLPNGAFPKDTFFQCGTEASFFGSDAITTAFAITGLTSSPIQQIPIDELSYPFELVQVKPDLQILLKRSLKEWCDQYNIFEASKREKYIELISTYTQNCSPKDASPQSLQLSNKFLTLYFALNDYSTNHPSSDIEIFDTIHSVLSGSHDKEVSESSNKLLIEAAKEFQKELSATQANTYFLVQSFGKFISASKIECEFFGKDITLAAYHENRTENIFVNQYLELWGVLSQGVIPDELRTHPAFTEQLKLATQIIYISNDIKSINRDQKTGKPNYISILAKEQNISIDEARKMTLSYHRNLLLTFIENDKKYKYDPAFGSSYFHASAFLKICMAGNLETMNHSTERYNK